MIRARNQAIAISMAQETQAEAIARGELCVACGTFDGLYYVGTRAQLEAIHCIAIETIAPEAKL